MEAYNQVASAESGVKTRYTLAKKPTNLISTNQTANSITLGWSGNGERYAVERSSNNSNWKYLATWENNISQSSYYSENLKVNTTYWFRVRAYNGDGAITQPGYVLAVKTLATVPTSVYDLKTELISDSKVKLGWKKSISEDAFQYRIYYSTSPDNIDYTVVKASVAHPGENWVSPSLDTSKRYYFVVRTVDEKGNEEQNTNIVSAVPLADISIGGKAAIKIPQTGRKVSGNRLMVMAELVSGEISQVKEILFEYKSETSELWQAIPASNANHPNPDTSHPYFTHWDVSGLENGEYNIRAVATNTGGSADPSPGYITITVDHTSPDFSEGVNSRKEQVREEAVDSRRDNTVSAAVPAKNSLTEVYIGEGSISAGAAKASLILNPADRGTPSPGLNDIGEYRRITLDGAQITGEALIKIPYEDEDGDGMVDGTGIPAERLKGYTYSNQYKKWEELPSEVDRENKVVTLRTTHFSLFALFGATADDYDDVIVYPNPFKPSSGHEWVKFDNLTADTEIQIMTSAGDLVFDVKGIEAGEYFWDVKNNSGRELASGVYIALITNNIGDRKIVRMAVLR